MTTTPQQRYTAVANALLTAIRGDISKDVPSWAQGMIPDSVAPDMAGQLAKIAVDTVDAYDAENK